MNTTHQPYEDCPYHKENPVYCLQCSGHETLCVPQAARGNDPPTHLADADLSVNQGESSVVGQEAAEQSPAPLVGFTELRNTDTAREWRKKIAAHSAQRRIEKAAPNLLAACKMARTYVNDEIERMKSENFDAALIEESKKDLAKLEAAIAKAESL